MAKREPASMSRKAYEAVVSSELRKLKGYQLQHAELFRNAAKLNANPELIRQATLSKKHTETLVQALRESRGQGGLRAVDSSAARLSMALSRDLPSARTLFGVDLAELSRKVAVVTEAVQEHVQPWRKALARFELDAEPVRYSSATRTFALGVRS